MVEQRPSDIVDEAFDTLRASQPPEGPGSHALEQTLQAVRQAQQKPNRTSLIEGIKNMNKFVKYPIGAAAGILIVIGLLVLLPGSGSLSGLAQAAEQLQQVAETNKAYKGWIHMQATFKPAVGSTLPATQAALPSSVFQHINTTDGTLAAIKDIGTRQTITLYLPARKEIVEYDSQSGEIRLGTMIAATAKGMAESLATSPTTFAEALFEFKKQTGRDPFEVIHKREDKSDRYDVTLFKDEQEASRLCQERGICLPVTKMTLWADPESRLIQKMQFVEQGVQVSATVSYGKPEIGNIYDLGAPRIAKVIDNRLRTDLAGVLERLDVRAVKGLGDCVAVITIADVNVTSGKADHDLGYVQLYEREPNRWFAAHYRVGDTTGRVAKGAFLPEAPAGWPIPDVKQLVGQIKDIAPTQYWLMDGDKGWAGWSKPTSKSYNHRIIESKERTVMLASVGLGGEIWPNRYRISMGGTDSKAEIITDPTRPELLGIHVERFVLGEGQKERQESTYWIDPAKDDMPVESVWRVYVNDNRTTEVSTRYLEYAQLPDGQWYPKRWQETSLRTPPRQPASQPHKSIQQYNLIIVPNITLDTDWFVNLADRFGNAGDAVTAPKRPASQPATGPR